MQTCPVFLLWFSSFRSLSLNSSSLTLKGFLPFIALLGNLRFWSPSLTWTLLASSLCFTKCGWAWRPRLTIPCGPLSVALGAPSECYVSAPRSPDSNSENTFFNPPNLQRGGGYSTVPSTVSAGSLIPQIPSLSSSSHCQLWAKRWELCSKQESLAFPGAYFWLEVDYFSAECVSVMPRQAHSGFRRRGCTPFRG